jgi:hypothetical protein
LFASKQGATTSCIASFALEQSAVGAFLARSVLGILNFGGIGGITQSSGLGVFVVHQSLGHGLLCSQGCTAQCHLHHENATIGLFHKISSEVAKKLIRTNINFKNGLKWAGGSAFPIVLVKELSLMGNALRIGDNLGSE